MKTKAVSKERQDFGDLISRAIAPHSWAEYDAGNGRCSNAAGFECVESIKAAARVIKALEESGFPVPPK